ncbi:hypothetical protein OIU76_023225 [Salix suchowensis]|nr:hypothetical protein OIU76_023225 [Salix suchowensis]
MMLIPVVKPSSLGLRVLKLILMLHIQGYVMSKYLDAGLGVSPHEFTFPIVAELEHEIVIAKDGSFESSIFIFTFKPQTFPERTTHQGDLQAMSNLFSVQALFKSANRLRDSLLPKDEPKLAIPLLLLIAQHRSVVVINADAPYIKMVSEQFDRCHGTLLQYVEFLCSVVTPPSAYAQLIPSLDDLVHMYHLDPEAAFFIYRPVMRLFKCAGSLDVFWPLDNIKTVTNTSAILEPEAMEYSGRLILDLGSPHKWSDLLETVKTMLPSKAWNSLSPDLYATFWGLTLYDLYVPRNRYESEIAKQHAALKALEEISDNSSSAITKRKKEKERIQESLDRLTRELWIPILKLIMLWKS